MQRSCRSVQTLRRWRGCARTRLLLLGVRGLGLCSLGSGQALRLGLRVFIRT